MSQCWLNTVPEYYVTLSALTWHRNSVAMLAQHNTCRTWLTLSLARRAAYSMLSFHSSASSRDGTATSNGVHMVVFWIFRIHSFAGHTPTATSTTAPIISRLPFCKLPRSIESEDWNRQVNQIMFIFLPSLSQDSGLVWCDAASLGNWFPTFWRFTVPAYSKIKQSSPWTAWPSRRRSRTPAEHRNHSPNSTASQLRKPEPPATPMSESHILQLWSL